MGNECEKWRVLSNNKNEKKKRIYKSTKMNYLASIFREKKEEKELISEIF